LSLLVAKMNKLSVDVSAIVLSVKDLSSIPPSLLTHLLELVILLLSLKVFAVTIPPQMNGKSVLPTQLVAVE